MQPSNNGMKRDLPAWRSMLYIPAINEKFVETGHTRGADAIVLDLEDSIAPSRKDDARCCIAEASVKVGRGGADVLVRVNRPWRLLIRDLEAAVSPRIHTLVLPKVPNAQHVQAVSEIVGDLESERGMVQGITKFIVLVEEPSAYPRMEEIAHADPRVIAMSLGSEDFSAACEMSPDEDALFVPKMQMLIFARAAGILPLGYIYSVADYKELDQLRKAALRARRLGFAGASCIHPAQVPIVNEAYSPTAQEVGHAKRVVEASLAAESSGIGSHGVDGRMIDAPVVERARRVLARHDAIQNRLLRR